MKIVLDANIFISSFFWGGNPRSVLERVISKKDELFISKEILNEIEDVVNRPKFHAEKSKIEYFIKSIEEISNLITIRKKVKNGSRDIKDNKYLECGIAGKADYIVSGDIHLLELKLYENINIVTAKEYLKITEI
jgi:putative PIN family toxin of toxin-antitoxin system